MPPSLLEEHLQSLPKQPGVYLMYDAHHRVIYVGKARRLQNRVRSYFQNSALHSPKIIKMIPHIERIETIVTDTEIEALVLEANLIWKVSLELAMSVLPLPSNL